MKTSVKSVLAFALVACCGMAQAGYSDFDNNAMSVAASDAGWSVQSGSAPVMTVTSIASNRFYDGRSGGTDGNNCKPNDRAWMVGANITWPEWAAAWQTATHEGAHLDSAKTIENCSKNGTYIVGSGSGVKSKVEQYSRVSGIVTATYWWSWITPNEAYAAHTENKDLFEKKLKLGAANKGTYKGVYDRTFTIRINTSNLQLSDGTRLWYPAVAKVDGKVYGDFAYALAQSGNVVLVEKNEETTCNFSTANRTFDLNGFSWAIKGGTITGSGFSLVSGAPIITGGTFDFDPSAYVAKGYEVDETSVPGKYVVKQGHVHSWSFGANGAVFTATCSGEGTCPVDGRVATLTVNFSDGKTYDGTALADSTLTEETHSTLSFAELNTGATIAGPSYTGDRTSAGDHTATWTITAGGTDYKISKTATITPKSLDITPTITLVSGGDYNFSGSAKTVAVSVNGLTEGKDYTISGDALTQVGSGANDVTYTVIATGKGNYKDSKSATWTIKAPTGSLGAMTAVGDGCSKDGDTAVKVTSSTALAYDAATKKWSFGLNVAVPYSIPLASKPTVTYPENMIVTTSCDKVTTSLEPDTEWWGSSYTYVKSVSATAKFTLEDILAAEASGELRFTVSICAKAGGYNSAGLRETIYSFVIPIDKNLVLLDEDKNQVYPAVDYRAKIVETKKKYLTLGDALEAAEAGQTVALIGGGTAEEFNVGKNVIVNLGGYGAAGASYVLNADNDNMGAKVTSSKAETVSTVDGFTIITDTTSGYVYTVEHAHVHHWVPTLDGAKLTITCDESGCKVPGCTTYVELKVTDNRDGNEPTRWIENQAAFIGIVNEFKTVATIGDINIVRTQGDNADLSRWYVGSYRATCVVTLDGVEHTLVNDFTITKPDEGYAKNGWVVKSSDIRYDENDSEKAIAATATTDTINYRGDDRDFDSHKFSIGEGKTVTFDFNGKMLTLSKWKTMTIENNGKGILVMQNVVIRQPRTGDISGQISTAGLIAFGTGVKVVNTADKSSNYCTITVNSGSTLLIMDGLYQCGFSGSGAWVTGGKFWEHDDPTDFVHDKGNTYVVRTIDETIDGTRYTRQVVAHAHRDAYSASANVITATCDAQDHEYCSYGSPTATLNAEDRTETGSAYAGASIAYSDGFPGKTNTVDDIVYVMTVDEKPVELDDVPSLFGAYVATLEIGGAKAEKGFAITLDKDDPEAKNEIPYVPSAGGEPMAINVSSKFIAENVENPEQKSTTDIMAELNEDGANGIPKIESYVLGLDPKVATSRPVAQPVQTSDADKLTLTVGGIDVKADAGAKVKYSVVTADTPEGLSEATPGAKQDSPIFELDLPTGGVKYYGVKLDLVNPE